MTRFDEDTRRTPLPASGVDAEEVLPETGPCDFVTNYKAVNALNREVTEADLEICGHEGDLYTLAYTPVSSEAIDDWGEGRPPEDMSEFGKQVFSIYSTVVLHVCAAHVDEWVGRMTEALESDGHYSVSFVRRGQMGVDFEEPDPPSIADNEAYFGVK